MLWIFIDSSSYFFKIQKSAIFFITLSFPIVEVSSRTPLFCQVFYWRSDSFPCRLVFSSFMRWVTSMQIQVTRSVLVRGREIFKFLSWSSMRVQTSDKDPPTYVPYLQYQIGLFTPKNSVLFTKTKLLIFSSSDITKLLNFDKIFTTLPLW
jgi:hypothetical protein